jgi:hypothetical protein
MNRPIVRIATNVLSINTVPARRAAGLRGRRLHHRLSAPISHVTRRIGAGVEEQPRLVGRGLAAGGPIRRQMRLPGFDVIFGLSTPAVAILRARLHQLDAIFAIFEASDRDKPLVSRGRGLRKCL